MAKWVFSMATAFWLMTNSVMAQDVTRNVVVNDVPKLVDVQRVSTASPHSGYPVPRFLSLKSNKANGRIGPSLDHPVKWQYQRKGLPLVVIAEMDIWRKVRDHEGGESWVHGQVLTGVKTGLVVDETRFYKKADPGSKIIALLQKNVIVRIQDCDDQGWCRVKTGSGQKGWVRKSRLWGTQFL